MGAKIAEIRINTRVVYIAAVAAGVPVMLLLMALANVLREGGRDSSFRSLLIALALFVPLGAVHELLHALAAIVYGRLGRADLRLGVLWKAGALACHIKVPVRVRTARIIGLAPLVVTGPATFGLLLGYPSHATAMLTGFAILACAVDVIMVYRLRPFAPDLLVVDHPVEPGFDIYAPEDSC